VIFFALCYGISFCLCFPFGVASLEAVRLSLKKEYGRALSLAVGTALVNGLWAVVAFLGLRTILQRLSSPRTEALLLGAGAVIAFLFGFLAWRDSHTCKEDENRPAGIRSKKDVALPVLKGAALGLLNPQTVAYWILVLSILKKAGIPLPSFSGAGVVFAITVTAGYWTFYYVVVRLAQRLRFIGRPQARARLARFLGVFFILLGLLLAVGALRAVW
jgi:threonine/homoserine/homoserine lactone efflux protein